MTRRHFRAIANAISELDLSSDDREHVAEELAKVCAQFNNAFDTRLFLHASKGFIK